MSYYGALLVIGVALQVMVLSAMLHGLWSRYPLVFSYVVVSFFATVTQESFSYYFGRKSVAYAQAYWIGDFAGTFLLLLVIIHLIRTAMAGHAHRGQVYWGLMLGMAATGVASVLFVTQHSRVFHMGPLLTELGRNYYFSAVLLNAILWVTLLRVQHPDPLVYLFSSGLGLKLTGAAIAHALRLTTSSQTSWFAANQILIFSYLASLYVWYIAARRFSAAVPAGGAAGESAPPVSFEFSLRDR